MNAEQNINNRVELRLYARASEGALIRQLAKRAGLSAGAWIYEAISERLKALGEQPLGVYPAEGHGGKRRGQGRTGERG